MPDDVSTVPYDEDKLKELVLYIAARTSEDSNAGAVKLNKYLYFADFTAVRKLGHPITGAEYQRLSHGPAPRRLLPVRDALVRQGDARLEKRIDGFGYGHDVLVPLREARPGSLSMAETEVVDEVIDRLHSLTATEVSDVSHREAGWQVVAEGDTIPYELAFVLAPAAAEPTPAIRAEAERLQSRYRDQLT